MAGPSDIQAAGLCFLASPGLHQMILQLVHSKANGMEAGEPGEGLEGLEGLERGWSG